MQLTKVFEFSFSDHKLEVNICKSDVLLINKRNTFSTLCFSCLSRSYAFLYLSALRLNTNSKKQIQGVRQKVKRKSNKNNEGKLESNY